MSETKKLFIWSGGGLPGLDIHAGIWRALDEAGIFANANCGTSAGAIVAAHNSSGSWTAASFGRMLCQLRDEDVRKERFAWKFRAPFISWWLSMDPVRAILAHNIPNCWEASEKSLLICATNDRDGSQRLFDSSGEAMLIDAVQASMAISGVFAPVIIGGTPYSDGGTSGNIAWPHCKLQNFDDVYVLIASRPLQYRSDANIISRFWRNADLMMAGQMKDSLSDLESICRHAGARLHIVWPELSAPKGSLHFAHDLIDQAYVSTKIQLMREKCSTI